MPSITARRAQITAIVTGLLGVLLALATPLLPVKQTVAEISWPQADAVGSVSAPLFSYVPIELTASVPCTAVDRLPDGASVLLSTASPSAEKAQQRGLFIRVTGERSTPEASRSVEVINRNMPLVSAPLADVRSGECRDIEVHATSDAVTAEFTGLTGDDDEALEGSATGGDQRPQITGLFTQLDGRVDDIPGLNAHVVIDSRYSTTPTALKWAAIIVGILAVIISLVALSRLDATDGRRHRRFFPARWWRLKPRDYVVVGLLLVWHIIGPNTSDDGYLLTMSRVAQDSDYTANYFRWFGAPEAPFGWYYQVFGWLSHVSVASVWMRIPALVCGIVVWLIVSHEILPRIGRAALTRPAVGWTAAAVFLVAWFPFNNGLRPEPIICLGALITWCSVERAIATGRLLPAAIACTAGAFSIAAGPTGVLAVAALVAGARPMFLAVVRRAREVRLQTGSGRLAAYLSLFAPIVAAGVLVIFAVFSGLTLAAFMESSTMKTDLGPSLEWYNEIDRYSSLFAFSADGSIARRFAVVIMILSMAVAGAVLIRKSRIPGTALGPARRIVGITFGSLLFLMFTPTKWTHHFGVFAGLTAALAALAAIAASAGATHSRRNRTIFAALVVFVTGLAFTAPNSFYYASAWGMPWGTSQVMIGGIALGQILLYVSLALMALALWFHFREPFAGVDPESEHQPRPVRRATRILTASPLGLAATMIAAFLLVTAAMTGIRQSDSYSVPRSNIEAFTGQQCGMADKVWVEDDPNLYQLSPVDASLTDPLAGPTTAPADAERAATSGFSANGVREDLETLAPAGSLGVLAWGAGLDPDLLIANSGGTGGGIAAAAGTNGSRAILPFGLDPARTPVMGSYSEIDQSPADLTSGWYRVPADFQNRPLVTFSAAGVFGSSELHLEYTTDEVTNSTRDADLTVAGERQMIDPGPRPSWRNVRVETESLPSDTTAVRIVADDDNLSEDHFIVVTPPRIPEMTTLQETVGDTDPVHVDWTSGLVFPCQRPYNFHAGVVETPKWRVRPGADLAAAVSAWQGALGGGPLGWLQVSQRPDTVATYLKGDIGRDWGALERYTPYDEATPAQIDYSTQTRSGLWSPAPIRR
ncbi:arabinosyltransferase domain-containing protein [Gordonia liuliyuniae]|uniref:Arabinosyltransferase domain-containing protein n=1 Tax=Gordonia liuliyuniae TaxID=2911517 RepID=A0ABS9ITR3_9ACTN|nr:arabinosyltransferase domain-containing protein [Gordonia liuliyuniae]MCF8588882.1 arabinosyltransferase domain-containing protein [Gordonia liuliyuniae]